MELALSGDEGALKELRKQKQEIKPDDKVLMHPKKKVSHSIFKTFISKITKQTTVNNQSKKPKKGMTR